MLWAMALLWPLLWWLLVLSFASSSLDNGAALGNGASLSPSLGNGASFASSFDNGASLVFFLSMVDCASQLESNHGACLFFLLLL